MASVEPRTLTLSCIPVTNDTGRGCTLYLYDDSSISIPAGETSPDVSGVLRTVDIQSLPTIQKTILYRPALPAGVSVSAALGAFLKIHFRKDEETPYGLLADSKGNSLDIPLKHA